jgi:hypothetical protein
MVRRSSSGWEAAIPLSLRQQFGSPEASPSRPSIRGWRRSGGCEGDADGGSSATDLTIERDLAPVRGYFGLVVRAHGIATGVEDGDRDPTGHRSEVSIGHDEVRVRQFWPSGNPFRAVSP